MEQEENNDTMLNGSESKPEKEGADYLEVPQGRTNSLVLFRFNRFNKRQTNQTSSTRANASA